MLVFSGSVAVTFLIKNTTRILRCKSQHITSRLDAEQIIDAVTKATPEKVQEMLSMLGICNS